MAYYNIEPWGPERVELPIATLTALTANVNRDSKKRPEAYSAKDFMHQWGGAIESEPDDDDGMAPDRVLKVMEGAVRAQEVEKIALAARRRAAERSRAS